MNNINQETIEILGLVAGTLTTISFVPQVLHIWKSRSGRDVSYSMFFLFSLGVLLWFLYGLAEGELPLILANGVTLVLALTVIFLKFWFERNP